MPISCADITGVARLLMEVETEPAHLSAVSRFFYGSMHRCNGWLDGLPGMASVAGFAGGTHQDVVNKLTHVDRQCTDEQKKRGRRLAALLGIMRQRRVTADYYISETLDRREIFQQVADSGTVFGLCDI